MAGQGLLEVIDLRTIVPLDVETIVASVTKTGRLLVVDEAYAMCGIGAEIAAVVMEHAFDELDARVGRCIRIPFRSRSAPRWKTPWWPSAERIVAAARAVLDGRPPIQKRPVGVARATAPSPASSGDGQAQTPVPAAKPAAVVPAQAKVSGVPLIMPNMDLIITEATVVAWLKKAGDRFVRARPWWKSRPTRPSRRWNRRRTACWQKSSPLEGAVVALAGNWEPFDRDRKSLTDQGSA